MIRIKDIKARQILDSRGNPTVEVDLYLSDGSWGRAAVPSGASTGSREAVEKRDGDKQVFNGKGVISACQSVNKKIKDKILGQTMDQNQLDQLIINLDGSENKSQLGANALLGVSMALSKALSDSQGLPLYDYFNQLFNRKKMALPVPLVNILNGGAHADNSVDFQEFMIVPAGFERFSDCLRCVGEIFHSLKKILTDKKYQTTVGDEGGFAPNLSSNIEAIEIVAQAVEKAGYHLGSQVYLALDVASSEFYKEGKYYLQSENKSYSSEEFADLLSHWCTKFPIISIEDGLDESDWTGWAYLSQQLGDKIQLVGDDLFVTNPAILKKGIEQSIANSILIKVNQIGTITETIEAMKLAFTSNYSCVVSHRSGETEDTTIADLAVGSGCGQIKTGSISRSDRTAKYNQLLRIEEVLGDAVYFAGRSAFTCLK